jgi:hypothetical protein
MTLNIHREKWVEGGCFEVVATENTEAQRNTKYRNGGFAPVYWFKTFINEIYECVRNLLNRTCLPAGRFLNVQASVAT